MVICHACKKENPVPERVGRRDTCSHCDADLHVCLNCEFYDPSAYNECREPQADRVLEKDKANFCDYFSPSATARGTGEDPAAAAKAKLDDLFKKS